MRYMKKILAVLLLACLLTGLCITAGAYKIDTLTQLKVGENKVTLFSNSEETIYQFVPGEPGTYYITISEDDCLYSVSGSIYSVNEIVPAENNQLKLVVVASVAKTTHLIAASGSDWRATITIVKGDEPPIYDPASFDWIYYKNKEEPVALEYAGDLEYVDITKPHTAVKGADGFYHLDTADGPILMCNLKNTTYFDFVGAASYGGCRSYRYDDEGNFVDKYDFNTSLMEYKGVYALNDDLIFSLQYLTKGKTWADPESPEYRFGNMKVDADTAWMFNVCYATGGILNLPHTHIMEHHAEVKATCHAGGMKEYWYCTECGEYFTDAEGKNGIAFSDLAVKAANSIEHKPEVAASCHTDGMKEHYYCAGCGKYYSDAEGKNAVTQASLVVKAKNSLESVAAVAASCHTDGMKAHYYCAGCNKYYSDAEGKNAVDQAGLSSSILDFCI